MSRNQPTQLGTLERPCSPSRERVSNPITAAVALHTPPPHSTEARSDAIRIANKYDDEHEEWNRVMHVDPAADTVRDAIKATRCRAPVVHHLT